VTLEELRAAFEEETSYEAYVLALLGDARQMEMRRATEESDDIRGAAKLISKTFAVSVGGEAVKAAVDRFRPLLFAAAYKTLDLLVESVMALNAPSGTRPRLTFGEKQKFAQTASPQRLPAPLDSDVDLWPRLASLHDEFLEVRHAVVHRRVQQNPNGDLQPYDRRGQQIQVVTATQVESFTLLVFGVREAVVRGTDDPRRLNAIAWHLNLLAPVHQLPLVVADAPAPIARRIIDDLEDIGEGRWRIRVKKVADHIASQRGSQFADLDLHARSSDGSVRVLRARWEDIPHDAEVFEFHERALPDWLIGPE
jgi:hypothetical protein